MTTCGIFIRVHSINGAESSLPWLSSTAFIYLIHGFVSCLLYFYENGVYVTVATYISLTINSLLSVINNLVVFLVCPSFLLLYEAISQNFVRSSYLICIALLRL